MSKIEWTQKTWNPVVGCSKVSAGCENCYAEKMAGRLAPMELSEYPEKGKKYLHTVEMKSNKFYWNGKTYCDEQSLKIPLRRKKPTMYFVCSMGDLFHKSVPFEFIDKVMAVIAVCSQHTFQVLTKRPKRMKEYWTEHFDIENVAVIAAQMVEESDFFYDKILDDYERAGNVLPNLWVGVTAENQETVDERIPILLQIPAAVRFVSIEPMLGKVNFRWTPYHRQATYETYREYLNRTGRINEYESLRKLDWVIVGCESGTNRRPCKIEWMQSIVNQCKDANVPVFVKQASINGKVNKDMQSWAKGLRVQEYPERGVIYGQK